MVIRMMGEYWASRPVAVGAAMYLYGVVGKRRRNGPQLRELLESAPGPRCELLLTLLLGAKIC